MQNPENPILIITITSDFPQLLAHINKYALLANEIFPRRENTLFYIEPIENGVIYFFKDLETLQRYYPIITDQELPSNTERIFIKPHEFPPKGFSLYFTPKNYSLDDLLPIFEAHCHSIHLEIQIRKIDDNSFEMYFPTYESFINYGRFMLKFFEKSE